MGKSHSESQFTPGLASRQPTPEVPEAENQAKVVWSKAGTEQGIVLAQEISQLLKQYEADGAEATKAQLEEKMRELKEIQSKEGFSAITPEGKEVKINLAERLKYWQDFYKTNNIDWVKLPDTISITPEQQAEMTRLITEHGFDNLMVIPEDLVGNPENYTKLHEVMSEGDAGVTQYYKYKNDGGLSGSKDKRAGLRLILTKDVQDLGDDKLFISTVGLSVDKLESDFLPKHPGLTGLAESEYLILQRDYFKRTTKHLDADRRTWLPCSTRPSSGRVPYGHWGQQGLCFDSCASDYWFVILGCRLAGSFEIKT